MNSIADTIVDMLAPILGKGMATSTVYIQCKKMGIQPENLSDENIEVFLEGFKKVMQIFAGEQAANEIVLKIKKIQK